MNAPLEPSQYSDPRDAAAAWFARARSGSMSRAEHDAMNAWLSADAAHRTEYALLERLWASTGQAGHERLRELAGMPPPAPGVATPGVATPGAPSHPPSRGRRAMLGWTLAGAGALTVGAVGVGLHQKGPPAFEQTLLSEHGQRRTARLPDNSLIDLNTDTRIVVRYYADVREVLLESGEANFSVTADPARPFIVRAGRAVVRVTGTRFNVRRLKDASEDATEDATEVAVSSGAVEVGADTLAFWRRATLGPGQGLVATRDGLSAVNAVDVAAVTAWRDGRIVFNNTPLPRAVAELNRYAPFVIRLEGARLAQVRIAGTVNIDTPGTLLELLPRIAPVRVTAESAGRYVLTPAP